jgi:hypothetical protein
MVSVEKRNTRGIVDHIHRKIYSCHSFTPPVAEAVAPESSGDGAIGTVK